MNNNANFFTEEKGPAAVLKHGVLRRYLATFAGAVGSTSPGHRVGYLDGYAGEGEYANPVTGVTSEGSPRIALKIAEDLTNTPREVHAVFVEKEKPAFESLQAIVTGSGNPHATALHGDVAGHLAAALQTFDDMPALVFLDPFGSALDH
ncbi:MAG: three-Cys-motif partner protein TcmP, partial [Leifsonia sp.]